MFPCPQPASSFAFRVSPPGSVKVVINKGGGYCGLQECDSKQHTNALTQKLSCEQGSVVHTSNPKRRAEAGGPGSEFEVSLNHAVAPGHVASRKARVSILTKTQPQHLCHGCPHSQTLPQMMTLYLEVSASPLLPTFLPPPKLSLQPQGPFSSISSALEALTRQPEDMAGLVHPSGLSWPVLQSP